jgi:hypothetical protein
MVIEISVAQKGNKIRDTGAKTMNLQSIYSYFFPPQISPAPAPMSYPPPVLQPQSKMMDEVPAATPIPPVALTLSLNTEKDPYETDIKAPPMAVYRGPSVRLPSGTLIPVAAYAYNPMNQGAQIRAQGLAQADMLKARAKFGPSRKKEQLLRNAEKAEQIARSRHLTPHEKKILLRRLGGVVSTNPPHSVPYRPPYFYF